jgi:hypothetical protein
MDRYVIKKLASYVYIILETFSGHARQQADFPDWNMHVRKVTLPESAKAEKEKANTRLKEDELT